jgi:hypothetical protein
MKSLIRITSALCVISLVSTFAGVVVASAAVTHPKTVAPTGATPCAAYTTGTKVETFVYTTTPTTCQIIFTTTTPGTPFTWVVPAGVTKIFMGLVGGGGGGGGATGYSGGGGGGGGQVKQSTHSVKPGMTMHINIGAGGTGGYPGYGLDNTLKSNITAATQTGISGGAGTHSLIWWLTTDTTRITVLAEGGGAGQPGINQMGAPATSKVYGGSVYTTYTGGYAEAFMYTPTPAPPAIPASTGVHPMKAKPYDSGGGPGGAGSRGNGNNSDNSGSTTRHGGQGGPGSELLTSETTALMVGG